MPSNKRAQMWCNIIIIGRCTQRWMDGKHGNRPNGNLKCLVSKNNQRRRWRDGCLWASSIASTRRIDGGGEQRVAKKMEPTKTINGHRSWEGMRNAHWIGKHTGSSKMHFVSHPQPNWRMTISLSPSPPLCSRQQQQNSFAFIYHAHTHILMWWNFVEWVETERRVVICRLHLHCSSGYSVVQAQNMQNIMMSIFVSLIPWAWALRPYSIVFEYTEARVHTIYDYVWKSATSILCANVPFIYCLSVFVCVETSLPHHSTSDLASRMAKFSAAKIQTLLDWQRKSYHHHHQQQQ